ncbi:ABC transporter permease [Paenibacillus sp. MBLB4367]|jgi:putative aldouronate transport system permease protein|uniref:ABC transporter permease n=1 Tax=Paenibacillus sp. MBLB4367 TaxID=3384767 RepID=UPI0039080814
MMLPSLVYYIVYKYIPMFGLVIAFKDYRIMDGLWHSSWVGLAHFKEVFGNRDFVSLLRNTLVISGYKMVFGTLPELFLALLLNEVRVRWYKKTVQTIVYFPYFLSWVIIYGILLMFLSPSTGLINDLLKEWGLKPISFLTSNDWFRSILVSSEIWKDVGFGSIIYLAAIAGIDPHLYEAATMDGAGRWRRMWHITVPSIMNVFVLLMILKVGHILDAGFSQIYVLYNSLVYKTADIIDTWVFRRGLEQMQYSYATAVGLFKSVVGLILIFVTNKIAKKFGQAGIW